MKAPRVAFNKDAVLTFLLSHGEKIVVGMVALAACGLAWGGVSALRSMQPTREQQPDAIVADASATAKHIEEVKIVPDDELTSEKGLAKTVARWLSPKVEPPPPHGLFNKPLFAELARRSSPDILPVEDLRAVSAVAVLAGKPKAAGDRPASVVPYVLVTGLIPVTKQQEEYGRRFANSSFRDPVLDVPAWSSFRLERMEVIPGTAEKWTPIDLKAVKRRYSADWAGIQPEPLLGPFVLGDGLEKRDQAASPIPFCSPLPQLLEGSWGFNALHPWCTAFLQRDAAERSARTKAEQQQAEENADVFGGAGGAPVPVPGPPPGAENAVPRIVEYRLFRFIDLAVVSGRTYRYRVQTICSNPNVNVPSRHLVDADLAKKPTLESPFSAATASVGVPDGIRMLVQPLKKQDFRRLKPGTVATMILGPTNAGAFGLRTLFTEIGGLANVDPQLNKRGDPRSRGEAIVSDRVLLDVRGRPEDRTESRTGKPTPPPEPLEMIFLRPDGTFETASSADSQADVDRYLPTLQPADAAGSAGDRPAQPPAGVDSPFGNPFAPKK